MEQKSWFIVESGTRLTGPFSLEEVRERFPELPKRSYVVCDGIEPIYSNDAERFSEVIEKGGAVFGTFASRSGVQSLVVDPFAEAGHFHSCSTNDMQESRKRVLRSSSFDGLGLFGKLWRRLSARSIKRRRKPRFLRFRIRHLLAFLAISSAYYASRKLEHEVTLSWLKDLGSVRMAAKRIQRGEEVQCARERVLITIWRNESPILHAIQVHLESGDGASLGLPSGMAE